MGISTLASQAFGAGNNLAMALVLQRALLVTLLGSLPCVLLLVFLGGYQLYVRTFQLLVFGGMTLAGCIGDKQTSNAEVCNQQSTASTESLFL